MLNEVQKKCFSHVLYILSILLYIFYICLFLINQGCSQSCFLKGFLKFKLSFYYNQNKQYTSMHIL